MCVSIRACVGAFSKRGLRCRGNPAPGVSGGREALSALCVITRGCRQSAHWCFCQPAAGVSGWIKVDQMHASNICLGRYLSAACCQTPLLINAAIHTAPKLTWLELPQLWRPIQTGPDWQLDPSEACLMKEALTLWSENRVRTTLRVCLCHSNTTTAAWKTRLWPQHPPPQMLETGRTSHTENYAYWLKSL